MKQVSYKQCTLQRNDEVIRGWIPTRGAVVGAHVEVKEYDAPGAEKLLWNVTEVFNETELLEDEVKKNEDRARGNFTAMKSYRGNK